MILFVYSSYIFINCLIQRFVGRRLLKETQNVGIQKQGSKPIALATSTSTGAVQTVHSDARHPQQTMSSVPCWRRWPAICI